MNRAHRLLSESCMDKYLRERLLPLYPEFQEIISFRIIPYKKHIWRTSFHVVIQYLVKFKGEKGEIEKEIFCSAHSGEARKDAWRALDFLWSKNFNTEDLCVPRPLFYSHRFRGVFYEGLEGNNLHYYLYKKNLPVAKDILSLTAKWFARLHSFPLPEEVMNKKNGRIKTVVPGKEKVLSRVAESFPEHLDLYKKAYDFFIKEEENFLNRNEKLWLMHGDAHPDNIIKVKEKKVGLIDFTDFSVADFARDLGCFKQQLEYMAERDSCTAKEIKELEEVFFSSYFFYSSEKLSPELEKRIDLYYYWTAIRTLSYLLFSSHLEDNEDRKNRIKELAEKVGRFFS